MTDIAVTDQYILDGRTPVPCADLAEWARWFKTANRQIACTKIGELELRTVFSGVDYRRFGASRPNDGPPLVFETMVFGDVTGRYIARCSTWEEAEEMHRRAVRLAMPQVEGPEIEVPTGAP